MTCLNPWARGILLKLDRRVFLLLLIMIGLFKTACLVHKTMTVDDYISDEIYYVSASRNILKLFNINKDWYPYPDLAGIESYLNLEHPPLGKYIIALSILVWG
jgi:Predicted membrane-bound dolichyl-phosphate-mannose-protein mannosyltransferase